MLATASCFRDRRSPKVMCEKMGGIWVPDWDARPKDRDYKGWCVLKPEGDPHRVQAVRFDDLNEDGWIKKSDGEIWCEYADDPGTRVRCTFLSTVRAESWCEGSGGTWEEDGQGGYLCLYSDLAVVAQDGDEDSVLSDDEYHCESLDANGRPSGEVITCPTDEYQLPEE
jgi:hypothetical protein